MSLDKRLTTNQYGDPVLTITVSGHHDIYRLAWHLQFGQCEFAALGRRIHDSQRRQFRARGWRSLSAYYGGQPRLMVSQAIRDAARALLATVVDVPDTNLSPEMLALRRAMAAKPRPVKSMWEVA